MAKTITFSRIILLILLTFGLNSISAQTTYYLQNGSVSAASTVGSWKTDATGAGGGTAATSFISGNGNTFNTISGQSAIFASSITYGSGSASGTGITMNVVSGSTATINTAVTITVNGKNANNSEFNVEGTVIFGTTARILLNDNDSRMKFTLGAGATFKTANVLGVLGTNCSLQQIAGSTVTFNTAANFEFNAAANQASLGLPTVLHDLTLSNSGVKTISGVTVNGVLSMEGTATISAVPTYGSTATLQYNTTSARTSGVEWPTSFSGTGGVIIASTGAITMQNAKTLSSTSNVTINSGASLIGGSFTHLIAGNWTNNGTYTGTGSTINFNGTAQTIGGTSSTTFNNVTLSGSGTKTFGIATTFSGNLTISSGVVANLSTFTHSAGTLTLNVTGTPIGSHGSTTSAATFKNNTYFAATTGIVNVTTNSCAAITAVLSGATTICSGGTANLIVTITGGNSPYTVVYSGGTVPGYTSGSNIPVSPGTTTVYSLTTVTGANGCPASVSGTPTVTVRPVFTSGTIASTGETICNGGTPVITIGNTTPASGGDGTITYSWRSSADGYTAAIGGATSATYLPPAGLTATTSYRRYAKDGTCNVTPEVSTNTWTVTVNAVFSTGTISSTGETICNGGTPAITIGNTTPASGGDGTITYSWRSSADGYTAAIGGATSATYLPPSGLIATTSYRRYAKDGTCNTTPTVSIGTWTVTVRPAFTSGTISSTGETICNGGTPASTIGNTTPASGGDGTITYSWHSSADGYTAAIGGATSTTYLPPSGLTATTSYQRYAKDGTCNITPTVSTGTWTVTVTPNNTVGAASSTPTLCVNTATSPDITHATTGATGISNDGVSGANGLPAGVSATWSSNTITISGTPTASGIFNYSIPLTGGCGSFNATGTITVNPASTAAVISGSASICSGSTINLQVAITGGTSPFDVVYTDGSSNFTVNTYTSGSNIPVSPTSTTTYTLISVTGANGCAGGGNSGSAVVTIATTTSTDGGATWDNGSPTSSKAAIFDGSTGTISADFAACSLVVTNNATVTVSSGFNVTLNGKITVDSGSAFTLNNNANLLQNTTAANTGDIVVKRNSAALKRLDYTLWSSPVTSQELYAFSPYTFDTRFYIYNSGTDVYNAFSGFAITGLDGNGVNGTDTNHATFSTGKGYLIRMPWNHPTAATVWNGTFTGVPNNGTITLSSLTSGLYYAIGNPYPSTIDADQFILDNSIGDNPATPGDGLYFWRKTNNAAASSYATYTTAGGVKSGGDTLNIVPNGVIQVGEGFIVKTTATSIGFNNDQRIANNDNQFLRATSVIERHRIWLNLSDSASNINQMMVAYMTGATQNIDPAIDGRFFNDTPTALNSLLNNEAFTIQGRSLPFDANDVVPLQFKANAAGNYTIAIDHVDGLFAGNQEIYLKDNLTTTLHDLNTGAYTFATTAGTFNDRFEIVYTEALGVGGPTFTDTAVIVYPENNNLVVNTGVVIMDSVKVFDIRGRLLEAKKGINASQTTIGSGLANEVLLVQITSVDGITVTKKVIR